MKAWLIINRSRNTGFSVVEVLLAITVFGMLATGLIGALVYGRASSDGAADRTRASMLADEGVEAVRNMANASFSTLATGTYGLTQSAGKWTLAGSSDTSDIFTRQVTIANAGTNRITITSTVTWSQPGGTTGSITSTTRLTNWEASMAVATSWNNAVISGSISPTGTVAGLKVDTENNYAYMVENTATSSFVIADITDPFVPQIKSTTTLPAVPNNILVNNGFAYITTNTATSCLLIYNVSNPAAPTLAKTISLTGTAACKGVAAYGTTLYVTRVASTTTNSNELNIINITTPASASVIGNYNNNITMNDIWVYGSYAYVAQTATSTSTAELTILNVKTPTSVTVAGSYNPTGINTATAISSAGTTAFLAYGTKIDAVNITTVSAPTLSGSFTASGTVQDLDATSNNNQMVFVGTNGTSNQFQIINASNPASMSVLCNITPPESSVVVNGVAYNSTLDVALGASSAFVDRLFVVSKN